MLNTVLLAADGLGIGYGIAALGAGMAALERQGQGKTPQAGAKLCGLSRPGRDGREAEIKRCAGQDRSGGAAVRGTPRIHRQG